MDSNLQYRAVKGRFVPSASKGVAPNKTLADAISPEAVVCVKFCKLIVVLSGKTLP